MLLHYQSHTQGSKNSLYVHVHSGQSNYSLLINSYVRLSINQHSMNAFMHILVHAFMPKSSVFKPGACQPQADTCLVS